MGFIATCPDGPTILDEGEEFRGLAEMSPNIVFSTNGRGEPLYTNKRWTDYTGKVGNSIEDWFSVVHPEDLPLLTGHYRNSIERGVDFDLEYRLRRYDGVYRWFLGRAKPLRDQMGTIWRWVVSVVDIDDAKIQQDRQAARAEEVVEERKWLEAVLNAVPIPVLIVSVKGEMIFANRRADELKPMESLPRNAQEATKFLLDPASGKPLDLSELPHARLARGERIDNTEIVIRDGDQTHTHVLFGETLPPAHGNPSVHIISFYDVTETKKITAAVKQSNHDLELFSAMASHDLEEPLRAISSFATLLQRKFGKAMGPEADELIDFIVGGSHRLRELVKDTLLFARAGKPGSPKTEVCLNETLRSALLALKGTIYEKKAIVRFDSLPPVLGYSELLEQLFQNLIGNALKYNKSQVPTVQIRYENRPEGWLFSIIDNGIGIGEPDREKVFHSFIRLHGRAEYPGTGLGLAFCKRVVELHGGKIWIESNSENGSTFVFSIKKTFL